MWHTRRCGPLTTRQVRATAPESRDSERMNDPRTSAPRRPDAHVPGASARLVGVTAFAAGLIVLASMVGEVVPGPALRFAGVAVVAVGWSFAIALLTPASRWRSDWRDTLVAAGLLREVPMPWFDRELNEAARGRLGAALRARPVALAALVAVLAGTLGALVTTRGLASPMTGTTAVLLGERIDAVVLDAPSPGLMHPLGVTIELLDASADPAEASATVRLRRLSDGVEREHTLVAGERAIVGGRGVSLVSVGVSGVPGVASVVVDGTAMTLARGAVAPVAGGTIEFVEADPNRLAQLGPGIRIIERDSEGAVVRDAWVYRDVEPGFDARHGGGAVGIELIELSASPVATLRVTASVVPARAVQITAAVIVALLLVLTVLASRPVILATGRDGDRTLYVIGWTPSDDAVALHRDVIGWLDAEQLAELEALSRRSGGAA